ncbi:MAG: hypothetical protein NZ108_05865 [Bacteroidia bacterium]|nr:hypothetical protein [Bacteroidia bacterium]
MKILQNTRFQVISAIVIAAILSRLLPHPMNFTAVGASALFAGAAYRNPWLAFLIPLTIMAISDSILGWHSSFVFVYISFFLTTLIGSKIGLSASSGKLAMSAVGSSVLFFLITNFGVWLGSDFYPQTISGLLSCYAAGLAFYSQDIFSNFFLNGLLADLVYSFALFGLFRLLEWKLPTIAQPN